MENKIKLSFSAIDPFIQDNIVAPTEKEIRGTDIISWGDKNSYPNYLFDLYLNCTTLQTIINGCTEFICGKKITSNITFLNDKEMSQLIYDMALSYMIYGGFALNVVRNAFGVPALVKCLDIRNVRSNADNTILYYSQEFNNRFSRNKADAYPKFNYDDKNPSSIYFYKTNKYLTYPLPMYAASVICAEIEKNINQFHLNNLENGFMGSVLVNLLNGTPEDDIKEEIERNFNEKFSGYQNAGRVVINYADDKEHAAEIIKLETEDFAERYNTLIKRAKQEIFTSFRCTPSIFGIPTENNGFSAEQYQDQYELFTNTVILPIQNKIISVISEIFNVDNPATIEQFTIDFEKNTVGGEIINNE